MGRPPCWAPRVALTPYREDWAWGWGSGLRVPTCRAPVFGDGPSGTSALGELLLWVRPGSWISPRPAHGPVGA